MNIVMAFCNRDARQAVNVLRWMHELDGRQTAHRLVLVAAKGMDEKAMKEVAEAGRAAFEKAALVITARVDERPWPMASNTMFRCAAAYMRTRGSFWWHEPDCTPLKGGWLTAIDKEYVTMGKPFMGCVVRAPMRHLTGCAVYPADIGAYNEAILQADRLAWDGVKPEVTLKHTHHTALFHHQWSDGRGGAPTFGTAESLKTISPTAVVMHRCKDGSLIERLREVKWGVKVPTAAPVVVATIEPAPAVVDSNAPKVFTYYQPVSGIPQPTKLLELWTRLWRAQGWQPVVLGEQAAQGNIQFKALETAIAKLPTVNHPGYERACYMRHLAMVEQKGGLLVDYDVMPRDFKPERVLGLSKFIMTVLEPTRVPCAVYGTKAGFQRIVDMLLSYVPSFTDMYHGKPHISDMEIVRKSKLRAMGLCVEHLCAGDAKRDHLGDGWKKASMIHFSTYSFQKLGWTGEKAEMVERAMATLV